MSQVHVICHRPGMHRGGRANPPHAAHDHGVHSPEQLRELLAEPQITVIVGEKLTEAHVVAIEAAVEAKKTKKGA